ncbi:uncharacterized protein DUF2004 [Maribacter spongiicola]|uniref:Uncharacterized protein DUF2004 n=2 Tax=Maribacter spongiicola TaxID=1206753 RepID=A0A4R7KA85_9FLAO|nr:uncharacterized protein DUF2004 [Maribacter spongiicola]
MNKYMSNFFGEIDLSSDKKYHYSELNYKNREISIDLNIYIENKPNTEQLSKIDDFLDNLQSHEEELRKFIKSNFNNNGISKEYIEYHTEEFDDEELTPLINMSNKEMSIEEQLLSNIYISRIGFYPNDNRYIVLDFYVNDEISDQILVLIVENDMSYSITWES